MLRIGATRRTHYRAIHPVRAPAITLKKGATRWNPAACSAALLAAAERIAETDGVDALSLRRVAGEVGTTTRAVYSLFGSKDALVVVLGARGFDLLRQGIESLAVTGDPTIDVVEAGLVFRRFSLRHPALFRLGVQHVSVPSDLARRFRGAPDRALLGRRAGSRDSRTRGSSERGP